MKKCIAAALALLLPLIASASVSSENFVGSFAEPLDGGNLDTRYSTFDGSTVVIVPRAHASEAISGATRWRNVLFAVRGVEGKNPTFRLPLTSPGTGKSVLSGDAISFQNIKLVWSYDANAIKWTAFDTTVRSGTSCASWKVDAKNAAPFTRDVVYVSINEHFPVADYYEWLESDVFTHAFVRPTPSEASPGSFIIGYQSGAAASTACSRAIPDMPLFGFVIADPGAHPTKLVVLVSGQHPYEGQNKVALQGAVDWILNSTSAEAKAYRANYLTVVYPFVNPTGELAGLWRGTAYAPTKDTNRNWDTTETDPAKNHGIDTVIVHKNAMKKDIAALGLGEPYAMFDYHQNFGDHPGAPDYVLHATSSALSSAPVARRVAALEYTPFYLRLASQATIADMPSDLTSQETLRGYMIARGAHLPLTFERSVYNTIAGEWEFGIGSVRALVDPPTVVLPPTDTPPVVDPAPTPEPPVVEPTEPPAPAVTLVADDFNGCGNLSRRHPDGMAPAAANWCVESGALAISTSGSAATNNSARAVIDAGAADVVVTGALTLGADNTGLILRSSNSSSYLRFVLTRTSWLLQKTAGGTTTTVVSAKTNFAPGVSHVLSARLAGPTVTLSVDGTTVGTVEVAFNQTATRHGVVSSGSGTRSWESFSVSRL